MIPRVKVYHTHTNQCSTNGSIIHMYVLEYIKQTSREITKKEREREYHLSRLITAIILLQHNNKARQCRLTFRRQRRRRKNRHALNNRCLPHGMLCVLVCMSFVYNSLFFISFQIAVLVSIIKREQKSTLELKWLLF